MQSPFRIHAEFAPAGDQPKAIKELTEGVQNGLKHQTLLGVTGSGKTYSVANVIANVGKPALVIAHNKTLAAQLVAEYREFFPENAVHYFVSYYDYYQPEAYVPVSDTYIEKEAQINEEIDRLRHAATQALLTRNDVIVVASVSCIYGLGSPEEYKKVHIELSHGLALSRDVLIRNLTGVYFERTNADLSPGQFRARGNMVEVMPTGERVIYRVNFDGAVIDRIEKIDAISRTILETPKSAFIFPAKHYVTPEHERDRAIAEIQDELQKQLAKFEREGKPLEAERLKRRTNYDLALIKEIGYCNGIENYSRHFDGRAPGEPPYTLLDYFPKTKDGKPDFLTVIDESHVSISQIGGMYAGDRARKDNLVEYGFRLPSAVDNRPLNFDEFEERIGQRIYTSATPGPYEKEHSKKPAGQVVEQIIRPTGLLDPEIIIRGVSEKGAYKGQVQDFIAETEATIAKGSRVLVTTLTKRMAEDFSEFLKERGVKAEYLHSDIETLERITILTDFRKGKFDVLVGINLLREGLDLPEVALVGILDADKEGFLRSETSLIQTIGRAARNVDGRVILYADEMTGSLNKAISESNRRRTIQDAYNKKHGITPESVVKKIRDIAEEIERGRKEAVGALLAIDRAALEKDPKLKRKIIADKKKQMTEAVKELDFETAAIIRDEIRSLEASKKSAPKK